MEWAENLLAPLDRTARWLRSQTVYHIALSGSYRLTAVLALGFSFRAAIGFELDIPTRDGVWATDDWPSPEMRQPWRISDPFAQGLGNTADLRGNGRDRTRLRFVGALRCCGSTKQVRCQLRRSSDDILLSFGVKSSRDWVRNLAATGCRKAQGHVRSQYAQILARNGPRKKILPQDRAFVAKGQLFAPQIKFHLKKLIFLLRKEHTLSSYGDLNVWDCWIVPQE